MVGKEGDKICQGMPKAVIKAARYCGTSRFNYPGDSSAKSVLSSLVLQDGYWGVGDLSWRPRHFEENLGIRLAGVNYSFQKCDPLSFFL